MVSWGVGGALRLLALIHWGELNLPPFLSLFSVYFSAVSECPLSSPCHQLDCLPPPPRIEIATEGGTWYIGRLVVSHFREKKLKPFAQVFDSSKWDGPRGESIIGGERVSLSRTAP